MIYIKEGHMQFYVAKENIDGVMCIYFEADPIFFTNIYRTDFLFCSMTTIMDFNKFKKYWYESTDTNRYIGKSSI